MKKKILGFALAACLVLPCAVLTTGCGEKPPASWEISQSEWEATVDNESFKIETISQTELEDNDLISLTYKHFRGESGFNNSIEYTALYKDSTQQNGVMTRRMLKEMAGAETSWHSVALDADYPLTFEDLTAIPETQFNAYVAPYLALIDYIDNGFEQFYQDGTAEEYTCDTEVMQTQNPTIASLNISGMYVGRYDGVKAIFHNGEKAWALSFESPLEKAFNKTTNFVIKGGPSTSDVEYGEYYFDGDNGFRMYTPNNTAVANRTDAYMKHDDDTYIKYTKQTAGGWATESMTQNAYDTTLSATKQQYIPFMEKLYKFRMTNLENASFTYKLNGENYIEQVGPLTFTYYDIEIMGGMNGISKITWKMKYSNELAESKVFNMELQNMYNTHLTFPTV